MTDANKSTWASFLKSIATFSGDLSTLTAPSFILSGTSLLEYSSYWGEHPKLFSDIAEQNTGEERILAATKWYISTLKGQFSARHESTGGEKKPLNPLLGETFHGSWPDGTSLIAEQVSHHPPISAYQIKSANGVILQGHNGQKSGFSGRTITVKQIGHATLTVPTSSDSEIMLITLPQLSLEGLFFGAPYAELTEKSYMVSSSGWIAEHEYSGRGWVSGSKNSIKTRIFPPGHYEERKKSKYIIEGQWNVPESLTICIRGEEPKSLFRTEERQSTHITVEEKDYPYESRRTWSGVAKALKEGDYELASKLKSELEANQRALRKAEAAKGTAWQRRYFQYQNQVDPQIDRLLDTIGHRASGTWSFIG